MGGRLNRSLLLRLIVTCWLGSIPSRLAAAAEAESVRLSIPDCADASGAQIEHLVALELASRENLTLADSSDGIQASLRCSDDRAVIEVVDPHREEPLVLEMQLAQTRPEARPRLLALAIAELIATSRLEHIPAEEKRVEAGPCATLFIGGGVARAYRPALWSPEIAAGAAYDLGVFALTAEIDFDWTSRSTTDATLDARAISLAIAPGLALVRTPLEWDVRVGLRVGYAWLEGAPRSANFEAGSISGVFLAPIAATALAVPLTVHWGVRLSLELGYVVVPVRGIGVDGELLLELKGIRAAAIAGPVFVF